MERLLNYVTDSYIRGWNMLLSSFYGEAECTFEMGTCSGHVYMERLFNDVPDCPFEVGTCSVHVCMYMERLRNGVA